MNPELNTEFQESHKLKKYRESIIAFIITAILAAIQFTWITFLIYWTTQEFRIANIVVEVAAIIIALFVASRDIPSLQKLSWTFLFLALPFIGIPTYYIFGRPQLTRKKKKKMEKVLETTKHLRQGDESLLEELRSESNDAYLQSKYISQYGGYPLRREDTTEYFDCGEAFLPKLLEDLKKAEKFIFIEFFIIGTGEMWGSILEILKEKIAQGVEVRLIYDDFGSTQVIPRHYERELTAMGIKNVRFNPIKPLLSIIMNNRDHRKIVVIDNQICYTGGVNLSDEYINAVYRFGYWKDAAVRMTGDACRSFTVMFLEMWEYESGEKLDASKYLIPSIPVATGSEAKGFVQPYADFPLSNESVGEVVYTNLITRAHKYIYIATPYLIIDSVLTASLINAAKQGVDVRIVVPAIPDKKITYQVTKSNFRQLVKGGVKIYTYTPGFIHTKNFVVDDEYATVGSINLDYRSLSLHFECGSFHYKTSIVKDVKNDMLSIFEQSKEVSLEECENKNVVKRTVLMIIKLFSPMM